MVKPITLTAAAGDEGRRLDRILRKALPDMPLSAIHSLLRKGRVLVDGVPEKGACRVRAGAAIQIPFDGGGTGVSGEKRRALNGAPNSDLPELQILWEDADFLVLNKPAGLAVHGSVAGSTESLETLARAYLAPKLPPSLSFKPGPLHRLDKPTSGIIFFSKSLDGARSFSALLRERRVHKTYLALLEGALRGDETWEDVLVRDRELGKSFASRGGVPASGGDAPREALTRVCPLAASGTGAVTLARLEIDTGRTHQIRVQAAAHGHPLAGDRKYGGAPQKGGFLLHARSLELPGQTLPGLPRRLDAPLPEYFRKRIEGLFGAAFAGSL
ncbi:MAG: RluA family pseudouridine synthase [Treponema sp.]|jgi:23S rRNA pseudouridine955/2504/2580 synthase|nr:RluA family pseudouridine synthase [Treponema sp.]